MGEPQAAQAHYMNADVTLACACERCCVTNGYLQRLVVEHQNSANSPKTLQHGLRRGQPTKNTTRQ